LYRLKIVDKMRAGRRDPGQPAAAQPDSTNQVDPEEFNCMRFIRQAGGNMRSFLLLLSLALASGACSVSDPAVYAGKNAANDEEVLAVAGGVEITEAEVSKLMAAELLKIARERQQVLERGVNELVAQKLLELEAAAQGVTADDLVAREVDAKVSEITQEEVDAFYEARQGQIRQPKEQVEGQIRQFLGQQKKNSLRVAYLAKLKEKHGFETFLEPLRIDVEIEGSPSKGAAEAAVTIVEFSDFECPFCSRVVPTLEKILADYEGKVRLVFRQFPLNNIHPNAQKAAEASLCAQDQGKFWELHDLMFKEQRSLGVEELKEKAVRVGLDTESFNECLDSSRYSERVADDLEAGSQAGVTGTPAMFINGRFISGAQPYEEIAKVIDDELASHAAASGS
jgi:protein-disulfide isomerase